MDGKKKKSNECQQSRKCAAKDCNNWVSEHDVLCTPCRKKVRAGERITFVWGHRKE